MSQEDKERIKELEKVVNQNSKQLVRHNVYFVIAIFVLGLAVKGWYDLSKSYNSLKTSIVETEIHIKQMAEKSVDMFFKEKKLELTNEIAVIDNTLNKQVSCPEEFMLIQSQDNILGCMQKNEHEDALGFYDASLWCFDNFGGRLPTFGEWYISVEKFDLIGEIGTWELLSDTGFTTEANAGDIVMTAGFSGITSHSYTNFVSPYTFRCFIPK